MTALMTEEHLDDCAALFVDVFSAPPWEEPWELADARKRLGDLFGVPGARGVCLVEDGRLLGFALGQVERSLGADHFRLSEMCVRTSEQRRGLGSTLLRALADALPGVENWYLQTLRDGDAAAFYEKNGFRPARRMAVYVRP